MLTTEENELLTRTGPGTPMGRLLRRYWVPALLSEELSGPDCPPLRVKLMGEGLVAFRDSDGKVGLLDRHCAHRGASLFFGRNEESGLRCVYHGWKFDADGRCVDMPSEPAESCFNDRVRLKAYPCRERGGLVWAYMGPTESMPELPEPEWAMVPDECRVVSKRLQECNWLQALEGGIDLSHISFLHHNLGIGRDLRGQELVRQDGRPAFQVVDTGYGQMVAARREADAEHYYWRISQLLLPWYTMFPPLVDDGMGGHAWVPIDDETCWAYSMTWSATKALASDSGAPSAEGIYTELLPGTFRPTANRDNDYLVDRAAQRSGSFTGIPGFSAQDCAAQESMGPICDRTKEHLGTSDVPIVALRRRLLEALHELEAGRELPGLEPASQHVRPVAIVLPKGVPFDEGARELLPAQ